MEGKSSTQILKAVCFFTFTCQLYRKAQILNLKIYYEQIIANATKIVRLLKTNENWGILKKKWFSEKKS